MSRREEQARIDRALSREPEAKQARRIDMQRSPTLRPETQRTSALLRIPFFGEVLAGFANFIFRRESSRRVARRQPIVRIRGEHFRPLHSARSARGARTRRNIRHIQHPGVRARMGRGLAHRRPR
ncbi:MAG: hypothetical protein CL943_01930 [Candidatus Diapherotrites archaeon]|uniref:Uncharacterized protein n=1 Tax=Candidatus Iainarchaeum sp. TaxID=3101447 RepID=A0A2D6M0U3_9ARCH|nr:hypothetical protein [Candidatus Diapherotrites archaeon]